MPKETFNDAHHGRTVSVKNATDEDWHDEALVNQPFLTVSWNRDHGIVQLATREGGDIDESKRERGGYFVDVDRSTVNGLIRTLRRARDQAFGADA